MAYLDIVTMSQCKTLERGVSANVGGYRQDYLHTPYVSCTCKAFKFGKGKHCKHIKAAVELTPFCGWHQQYSSEQQTKKGVCPKCGGETMYVRVGV